MLSEFNVSQPESDDKAFVQDALHFAMLRIALRQLRSAVGEAPFQTARLAHAAGLADSVLEETR